MRRVSAGEATVARDRVCESRPSGCEDRIPSDPIVRIQPPLDLLSILVAEHAHDAGLDVQAVTTSAHEAHCADMVIAREDIAFREPEPKASHPVEPGEKRIPSTDVPTHVVRPRNVPNGVHCDEAFELCAIAGSKRVGGSPVGNRIGVIPPHGRRLLKPIPSPLLLTHGH